MAIETTSADSAPTASERRRPRCRRRPARRARRRRYQTFTRRDRLLAHADGRHPGDAPHRVGVDPALLDGGAVVRRVGQPAPQLGGVAGRVPELLAIFTVFDNQLFPAIFNNLILIVLLFVVLGDRRAVRLPARQEHPRHGDLPEHLLLPGRPVARGRRLHLEGRDVRSRPRADEQSCGPASRSTGSATRAASSRSTCRASTPRSACRRTSPRS